MTKYLSALTLALSLALAPAAIAQVPTPTPAIPLKVQIVISRYQSDRKISSLPYTLSVNAGAPGRNSASIRMGTTLPIVVTPVPAAGGEKTPAGTIQYRDVGTNIDCEAQVLEDGRFRLQISVDDSSVAPDERPRDAATSGSPSFRSFRAVDGMVLKDGGTSQFTTATDKVSGETVKIDVTLTVVK